MVGGIAQAFSLTVKLDKCQANALLGHTTHMLDECVCFGCTNTHLDFVMVIVLCIPASFSGAAVDARLEGPRAKL